MKVKYQVIFVRKEHGTNQVMLVKKLRNPKSSIRVGVKSYLVDYSSPLFIANLTRVYIIDYDSGNQIIANEKGNILTPGELDVILGTKIVKEITQSVAKRPLAQLIPFIIGLAIGLLAGYLICNIVMQGKLDELTSQLLEDVVIISSYISNVIGI